MQFLQLIQHLPSFGWDFLGFDSGIPGERGGKEKEKPSLNDLGLFY
jgi:hypothetical protein